MTPDIPIAGSQLIIMSAGICNVKEVGKYWMGGIVNNL